VSSIDGLIFSTTFNDPSMPEYFAYGSNCNSEVMRRKGVPYTSRCRAVLRGYRLLFNKRALRERLPEQIGFANINPSKDSWVEGILYEIPEEGLETLDRSERYPEHYDRVETTVETDEGPVRCWVYRAQPDKIADGLIPSRNYLNHILSGKDFLSRQYFEALDRSQVYHADCSICRQPREIIFVRQGAALHPLCQPCREARIVWGDALGRTLTVEEAEAVMTQLVMPGPGFESIPQLIEQAVARGLIQT
jgi:gamma-glutamylcyclotransferase